VPAAAVIPAPIAYIKIVAVKTLVVEILLIRMGYLTEYIPIIIDINPTHPASYIVRCSELLL
jgi:hypothetical protein